MCSPVTRPAEGNLHDPPLGCTFGRIEERRLPIEAKENLLNDILGFTAIIEGAESNREYQSGIAVEEQIERISILRLQSRHEFFIARRADLDRPNINRANFAHGFLPTRSPYQGKCQGAPI
jgi:hypothetical protein